MTRLMDVLRGLTLVGFVEGLIRRWRMVTGGLVVVLLAVGAWAGYEWYRARLEEKAVGALIQAYQGVRKIEEESQRETALIEQLRQVADQHAGTATAGESLLRLGNILYELGKYDQAREAFARYLGAYSRGPLRMKAAIGKAYAEESKGDLQAAEETLLSALRLAKGDPLTGEAEVSLARLYEAQKKTDEAVKLYGQIAEKYPHTQWAQIAAIRLPALHAK